VESGDEVEEPEVANNVFPEAGPKEAEKAEPVVEGDHHHLGGGGVRRHWHGGYYRALRESFYF
jgi:hypothetical protein